MTALRFKKASGLMLWWLSLIGMVAIVTPWGVCYYRGALSKTLRRHEEKHWEQYQRHGKTRFVVLYLIESIRHGYKGNRFEVEARKAECVR